MRRSIPLLLTLVLMAGPTLAGGLEMGKAGGDFALPGAGGENVTLAGLLGAEGTEAVVVLFTSYTCPYSLRADLELLPMLGDFGKKGVAIVSIYPNRHEEGEAMREYAAKTGFTHIVLRDPAAAVARRYGVEVTPTFFLFDKTRILRYRGNLSGLSRAVDSVLAGETVETPSTPSTGCTVKWPDAKVPDSPVAEPTPDAAPVPAPESAQPPPRRGRRDGLELTDGAKRWLHTLIDHLATDDPFVRRSAAAAILAFGPIARPALEAARDAAENPMREELGRLIERLGRTRGGPNMAEGPGRRGPGGRGGPGVGGRGGSMLAMQKGRIEEAFDLTDEQQASLDELFKTLGEKERELAASRESGEREGLREGYRDLMEEFRAGLAKILTEEQWARFEEMRPGRGRGGLGGR